MKRDYLVGDECWIKIDSVGPLCKGQVVEWFTTHTQTVKFYIIQLDDADFRELLIRDATLMSPSADGPLPVEGFLPPEPVTAPVGAL